MTIYSTGTVSVSNGNAVVTGSGTAWAVALVAGGMFSSAGVSVPILSVDSDTQLTLDYPWPGTTATGAVYAIARESSEAADIVDLNDKLSRVLVTLSLVGITPNASGTIAERDALTLAVGDKGFLFLHAELGYDFEFYRWSGSVWDGPFATRGTQGASGLIGIWRGPWLTATTYYVNDAVSQGGSSYICVTAHTSGTFATDLAASKWQLVAQKGDTGAAGVVQSIVAGSNVTVDNTDPANPVVAASGINSILTTRGDIVYRNATTASRLAASATGYLLQTNGTGADPSWAGFLQAGTGAVTRTWQDKARERVTPEDFGAKGDVIVLQDGVTTNGSAVLTSASASFTAADVGKIISVKTGNTGGTQFTTTITGYNSPTSVTMGFTAANSATGEFFYGTNDNAALQAAINFATAAGAELHLSGKRYLSQGSLTASGVLVMRGAGMNATQIIMQGAANNFSYTSSASPYPIPHPSVTMEGLAFVTGYLQNTSSAVVNVSFSSTGSPYQYLGLRDFEVSTLGNGFNVGILADDASAFNFYNVHVENLGSILAGSVGIRVSGAEKPIDMYMFGCRVYFCDIGVDVVGQPLFADVFEGIVMVGCLVIVCNNCVQVKSATATPYFHANGCNFNGYQNDIVLQNIVNFHIVDNLFYAVDRVPHEAFWSGIQIVNDDAALTSTSANLIEGNIFSAGANLSTNRTGIQINAGNSADTNTTISGNVFDKLDTGVLLFSGATKVKILDDNTYQNVTTEISNSGTGNSIFQKKALAQGAQLAVAEQFSILTTDFTGSNVNTAQPVFSSAQDTITVAGATTYAFEAEYEIDTTGTTSHQLGILFGGTATLFSMAYSALATNGAAAGTPSAPAMTRSTIAGVTNVTAAVAAATQNTVRLRGIMRTNASGTFIPQFQYSAAPGAAPTIKANSFFRCWPIGDNNVASLGSWN